MPSASPQSGPMCPQHTSLRLLCNIMSNPCPQPRGVKVINSTIAIHRTVDYSSHVDCSTLQHIVFMQFGVDNAPTDVLSHCRVVFSHSQASRSLSMLTCLQMQIVFFRQLHDLSPWQRLYGISGKTSDWTHNNCICPCQASMVTWHLISSASAATGLPATTRSPTPWSNGHHQPHGLRPTQELVPRNYRMFSFLPPSPLGGKYRNSLS